MLDIQYFDLDQIILKILHCIASNFSAILPWKTQTFMQLNDEAKAKTLAKTMMRS